MKSVRRTKLKSNKTKDSNDPLNLTEQATSAFEEFKTLMRTNEHKVIYGEKHIMVGANLGVINKMLITETFMNSMDPAKAKSYKKLFRKVYKSGGETFRFTKLNPSTEELDQLTGVAAILHYPVPYIDEIKV